MWYFSLHLCCKKVCYVSIHIYFTLRTKQTAIHYSSRLEINGTITFSRTYSSLSYNISHSIWWSLNPHMVQLCSVKVLHSTLDHFTQQTTCWSNKLTKVTVSIIFHASFRLVAFKSSPDTFRQ